MTTTTIDYDALWTQAATEHSAANERLQQANKEATESAFREVVYAAASHGLLTVTLGSSDQGTYMLVEDFTDASGNKDLDIEDDLWAVSDLDDYYEAAWTANVGVTSNFLRSGTTVVIDIPVAAAALAAKEA